MANSFCESMFKCKWLQKRKHVLTAKLLKQGYRYHILRKAFSKLSLASDSWHIYHILSIPERIDMRRQCSIVDR